VAGFDYVTVGHVTVDVLADAPGDASARRQPGGGAFYSALQAARLGLRTLIVTRGVPGEIEALLEPYRGGLRIQVQVQPAASTTTLLTDSAGPARRQRLLAWAGPMAPPRDLDAAILHLAPVARETPPTWSGAADFVGLTPQGLVRGWGADGELVRAALAQELLPARLDAAVLSADELPACAQLLPRTDGPAAPAPAPAGPGQATIDGPAATAPGTAWLGAGDGPVVAVTSGAWPTAIHVPGAAPLRVPVEPVAEPREDLGAGDVFAAAFFVALYEGQPPAAAGAFANAAAAVRIAGAGPGAIGARAAVQAHIGDAAG